MTATELLQHLNDIGVQIYVNRSGLCFRSEIPKALVSEVLKNGHKLRQLIEASSNNGKLLTQHDENKAR